MSKLQNSSVKFTQTVKTSFAKSCNVEVIGQGQALVLLHGWGWHSGIWQHLLPALSQHFQLFLIDLPGFGHSQYDLEPYTIENVALAILSKAPESAIYLGWSLGGMIASWIAIHQPQRISHLITIASSPRFIQDTTWPGVAEKTLRHFSTLLLTDFEKTLSDFLELQLRGNPRNLLLLSDLKKQLLTREPPKLTALLGGLHLLQTLDLRSELIKISCPSLHLLGQYDSLVPAMIAERISVLSPQARCQVIAKSGHMPFLNEPEFLNLLFKELLVRY